MKLRWPPWAEGLSSRAGVWQFKRLVGPRELDSFAWCDEDTWAEWVNGEVIVLTPASDRHQDLVRFLVQVLGIYVETRGLGVVRPAPFQMKTGPDLPGRGPDIIFVARENLGRLKETHLEGPADLAVEITSPETRLRDRGEKFAEYEMGRVKEYWLIDSEREEADFYRLDERGRYRLTEPDSEGVYRPVVVPDFWLKVGWLWEQPLPSPLRTVAEIAGVEPQLLEAFDRALRGKRG